MDPVAKLQASVKFLIEKMGLTHDHAAHMALVEKDAAKDAPDEYRKDRSWNRNDSSNFG